VNPFAARPDTVPRAIQPEVMGPLDQLQVRLRALGATEDEILALLENWWVDSDDWGDDDRRRVRNASDTALRAMIVQSRVEFNATR